MKQSLFKNIILTVIALALLGLARLIFNVVIGKSFSASILGNVNLAISTATLFSIVAAIGFGPAAMKYLSEYLGRGELDKARHVFRISFFCTFSFSLILGFVVLFLSELDILFPMLNIEKEFFLLAIPLIPLYALYTFYKNAYYGVNRVESYARNEALSNSMFFITLAIVVILRAYILLPFLVLYLIFSLTATFNFKEYFRSGAKESEVRKKVLFFSGITLIGTFASMSRLPLSNVMTGFYLSDIELGYYVAAFSIVLIIYFFPKALSLVIFPSMSFEFGKNDIESVSRLLNITTLWLSIIVSVVCGILLLSSSLLLEIFFTGEYVKGTFALQILILSAYSIILANPSLNVLSGTKYVEIPNIAGVLGIVLSFSLWLILIPRLGIIGTAFGYFFGSLINAIIPMYYARKHFNLKIKKNTLTISITALLLLASFALQYLLNSLLSSTYSILFSTSFFAITFTAIFRSEISDIWRYRHSLV